MELKNMPGCFWRHFKWVESELEKWKDNQIMVDSIKKDKIYQAVMQMRRTSSGIKDPLLAQRYEQGPYWEQYR